MCYHPKCLLYFPKKKKSKEFSYEIPKIFEWIIIMIIIIILASFFVIYSVWLFFYKYLTSFLDKYYRYQI